MKHVEVFGPADRHDEVLQRLQSLAVLEIRRLRPPRRQDKARRELTRLLEKLRRFAGPAARAASGGAPGHAPATPPGGGGQALLARARRLVRAHEDLEARRRELEHTLDRQRLWGDVSPDELAALGEEGVHVQCWVSRDRDLPARLRRDGVEVRLLDDAAAKGGDVVFCTVTSGAALDLDHARNVAPPAARRRDLEQALTALDDDLAASTARIRAFVQREGGSLARAVARADGALALEEARSAIYVDDEVFVLHGWIPTPRAAEVREALDALGGVASRLRDPLPDEDPPTLTEYARWVRPIRAVFDFMGYKPGYREYDAGDLTIVFFTAFSALLINDGGYGLLLLAAVLLAWRPLARAGAGDLATLGLYVAVATAVFGLATGSLFGVQLDAPAGVTFARFDTEDMIRISFTLGIVHLSLGRGIAALAAGPGRAAVAQLGWLAILWAVYLAIVNVFTRAPVPGIVAPLLAGGAGAVVLFGSRGRGAPRDQLVGLGLLAGNATTVFSDVMSYIRLMAVGFASMSLAMTTNTIAAQTGHLAFALPVLLLGHAINLGLGLVALFVHGLRLNTLEFSRQAGVQWTGRPFAPLAAPNAERIDR